MTIFFSGAVVAVVVGRPPTNGCALLCPGKRRIITYTTSFSFHNAITEPKKKPQTLSLDARVDNLTVTFGIQISQESV